MKLGIENKVALVTGGVQGIGSSITRNLLNEGATVIATSRSQGAIEEFVAEVNRDDGKLITLQTGLTDANSIPELIGEINNLNLKVDILVNNAGHTMNVTDPHCSIDDWRDVFRLNFEVPVQLINALVPGMKARQWGRIVNITSCAGLENSGPVTFSTVKAALTAYTRSMGRVLAIEEPGVVLTAVFPGVVLTKGGHWEHVLATNPEHAERYLKERCPLGRFGEIDEIGPIVTVYCSQLASFCHGAIVPVDAGQSKHFMSFNYME
jgi:NAD(P)-dependent dehydrogenase (short-subunit alcohol dehydrogenase family)